MPNSIQLKNIKGEDIFPVVINEGLQSVNKQVTIPTGSTVASVTLDTDKYNIIDTIDSKFRVLGDELKRTETGSFTESIGVIDKSKIYKPQQ